MLFSIPLEYITPDDTIIAHILEHRKSSLFKITLRKGRSGVYFKEIINKEIR